MRIVLIYVGISVIVKGRVIESPSISNIEDMAVTCTQHSTEDGSWEDFILFLIDGVTERNGTLMSNSHLNSRLTNSGEIPRYQTGAVVHFTSMQDLVERATTAEYPAGYTSCVQ